MKHHVKLTLMFSAALLAIGCVIAWTVYTLSISTLDEQIKDKLEDIAFLTINKIDRMFYERHAYVKALASDPVISSGAFNPKQLAKRLIEAKKNSGTLDPLSFFALDRKCIADTSPAASGSRSLGEKYWLGFENGKDSVMDVSPGDAAFCFAALVKDRGGAPLGIVASRMPVDKLHEITKDTGGIHELHKGFKVDLVNSEGLILYSNYNTKGILKDRSPEWEHVKIQLAGGDKTGSRTHYHTDLGQEEIYAFATEEGHEDFKGNGWVLLINVPSKVAFASAAGLRNRLIITGSVVVFFALAAAVLLFRVFAGRMERPGSEDAIEGAGKGPEPAVPFLAEGPAPEGADQPEAEAGQLPHHTLSSREYQIMLMIAGGESLTEIGNKLSLSVKTVSTYRTRVLKKMDLKNNAELTQYVINNGL